MIEIAKKNMWKNVILNTYHKLFTLDFFFIKISEKFVALLEDCNMTEWPLPVDESK